MEEAPPSRHSFVFFRRVFDSIFPLNEFLNVVSIHRAHASPASSLTNGTFFLVVSPGCVMETSETFL